MSATARSRSSTSHTSPSGPPSSPPLSPMTWISSASSPSSFPSSLLSPLAAPPPDLSYPAPQLSSSSAPNLPLRVSPIKRAVPEPGEFTTSSLSETRFSPHSLPLCIEPAKSDSRFVTQPSKNIQVVCRLRPIQKEAANRSLLQNSEHPAVASPPGRANTAFFLQGNSIHVRHPPSFFSSGGTGGGIGGRALQEFTFDCVFDENSSQQAIFERIGRPLVLSVCSGFNATLVAYGQSSSGKTYTVIGDRENDDVLHYGNKRGDEEVKEGREEQRESPGADAGGKMPHHRWTTSIEREGAGEKAYGCSARQEEVDEEGGDRKVRECDGLLPRMINGIFTWTKANENTAVKRCVRTAAVEIYNENIRDLISGKCGLKIQRQKQNKGSQGGVAIVGLQEKLVEEPHEAFSVLEKAIKERRAAATRMNTDSSRSHFIFCITIQEIVLNTGDSKVGRLTVVDLAGSERVSKTGSMGVVLHEGSMINKSLMCLGKVINALAAVAEKNSDSGTPANASLPSTSSTLPSSSALPPSSPVQQAPVAVSSLIASSFVPYRDSKLTRVLQDALGGNSNTCLILSCSQDAVHLSESISTLRFGQRAMRVKNSPKMNVKRAHEEAEFRYKKSHQHLEAEYQAFVSSVMGWAESTVLKFAKTQVRLQSVFSSEARDGLRSYASRLPSPLNEALAPSKNGNRLPRSRDKSRTRVIAFSQEDNRILLNSTASATREHHSEGVRSDIVEVLSALPKPSVSFRLDNFDHEGFLDNLWQKVNHILYGGKQENGSESGPHPTPEDRDPIGKEGCGRGKEDSCERETNVDPPKMTSGARSSSQGNTPVFGFSTDGEEGEHKETSDEGNEKGRPPNAPVEEGTSTFFSGIRAVTQPGESSGSVARVRNNRELITRKLEDEIEAYVNLGQEFHRRQMQTCSFYSDDVNFRKSSLDSAFQSILCMFSKGQDVSSEKTSHPDGALLTLKEKPLSTETTQNEIWACRGETKGKIKKSNLGDVPAAKMGIKFEGELDDNSKGQNFLSIATETENEGRQRPHIPSLFPVKEVEKGDCEKGRASHPVHLKEQTERHTSGFVTDWACSMQKDQKLQFPFVCPRRSKTECLRHAIKKDDELRKQQRQKLGEKEPRDGESDRSYEKANETLWLWEKVLALLERDSAKQNENHSLQAYIKCQDEHIRQLNSIIHMFLQDGKTEKRK